MSNQQQRHECRNQQCTFYVGDRTGVIARTVCNQCHGIQSLSHFVEWLDDQLFELELAFTDFQTAASRQLKSSDRG